MNPELRRLFEENFYYIILAGIGLGLVLGAVPLFLGIKRGKRNLGFIGFVLAGVIGAFSPILSLIVVAVFMVLIIKKSGVEKAVDPDETPNADLS